jgi:glyoxylase-like metal-dependent hydrolase (beta-lactamase superfamily II)
MTEEGALDAGGIRCRVMIDGWRTESPRFVFRDYDEAVHGPEVTPRLDADGRLPGRFAALLIEAPSGFILVDAGIGPFAADLEAGLLAGELDALGVSPTDIRTVVITHGHADHVGGLVTNDGVPAFAEARHVVHTAELTYWRSAEARGLPGGAGEPARVAFGALRAAGLLDETAGATSIALGVEAIDAPGHTPGHLAVVVGDALLWAGDAIVATPNVAHPEWVSAADMDPRRNEATRRALLGRAADDRLVLAASHLPERGRVRRRGDGFAFEPID